MEELEIGSYKPDATEVESYTHADEFDMCVTYSEDGGEGDSLGGGSDMFFCHNDPRYVFSAEKLWYFDSNGKYVGQRHPNLSPEDHPMSRDHYHSTLSLLKMHYDRTGSTASMMKIKEITDETGYIISKMARRGLGLKWWSEAIQGKKGYQVLWHINGIIQSVLWYLPLNYILGKIANFTEEVDQEDWIPYPEGERLQDLPKWKQIIEDIMYPSYALQMVGWKLYVLDGFPLLKKTHQAVYRPMVGKTNYIQQMLFGLKPKTQSAKVVLRLNIESYKAMKGGRWSGYLSNRNDREMKILDPPFQYNNVDVDIARKLYNETQL